MANSDRDGGFLRPKERALLAKEGYRLPADVAPPKSADSEKTTRHRINNEVTSVSAFPEVIERFRADLATIRRRQFDTDRQQVQIATSAAIPKLERLRDEIDRLIKHAEDPEVLEAETELSQALNTLYEDLPYYPGGSAIPQESPSPEELDKVFTETEERKEALVAVLQHPSWLDVLDTIETNGKCQLPDEPYEEGGWNWNRIASELDGIGLVEKDDTWSNTLKYEITERGKAVLRAYQALENTPQVRIAQEPRPETDVGKVILETLAEYFDDFEV